MANDAGDWGAARDYLLGVAKTLEALGEAAPARLIRLAVELGDRGLDLAAEAFGLVARARAEPDGSVRVSGEAFARLRDARMRLVVNAAHIGD